MMQLWYRAEYDYDDLEDVEEGSIAPSDLSEIKDMIRAMFQDIQALGNLDVVYIYSDEGMTNCIMELHNVFGESA